MEDLISIGCIGLIKAVNSFDSGKEDWLPMPADALITNF